MNDNTPTIERWTTEELVAEKLRLRDYLKKLDEKRKEHDAPYHALDERIDNEIINRCHEQGRNNQRTNVGTAYLVDRVSVTIEDKEKFAEFVLEDPRRRLDFLDMRANKTAVNGLVEESGELPPGVKRDVTVGVNVRRV